MIFLDNASTTKVFDETAKIALFSMTQEFFNPSSLSTFSFEVAKKIEGARKVLLSVVNAGSCFDVVFLSSATEASNLAFNSFAKDHILVGAGEHPSVFEPARRLAEKNNVRNGEKASMVEFVPLNFDGTVDFEKFKKLLKKETTFVSIQLVSNETGAINDIGKLAKFAKSVNPNLVFHVDAVQALCKIKVDLEELGVDAASFSAHKVHAPKGVGALIFKKNLKISPLIFGGGQESGKRSGTENVPGILAFASAINIAEKNHKTAFENVFKSRALLLNELSKRQVKFRVNEAPENSPFILSLSFENLRGETLMHALEKYEIVISTGAACSSKKTGNRVLREMGRTADEISGNVRISFGALPLKREEILFVAEKIAVEVEQLSKIVTKVRRK